VPHISRFSRCGCQEAGRVRVAHPYVMHFDVRVGDLDFGFPIPTRLALRRIDRGLRRRSEWAHGEPGHRIQPNRNAQMLNLRSLAAILYSAIRFSRAAFLRSLLRSKALINAQKMATNMDTNTATNRAASMPVS